MGRLWQTLILCKWKPLFANIPVESLVYEHQAEYYAALNRSTNNAESSVFIEFMLKMILRSCKEINFTSFAKYPDVILGIDGEAHT